MDHVVTRLPHRGVPPSIIDEMLSDENKLLTSTEVAAIFGVDPKTVCRWSAAGKLPAIRTFGGHRRYQRRHVLAMIKSSEAEGIGPLEAFARWVVTLRYDTEERRKVTVDAIIKRAVYALKVLDDM